MVSITVCRFHSLELALNSKGIPIGKLALYCSAGGLAPHRVLPVVLDVGTNNEELLNDKYYLGVHKKRLRGEDYFYLIDEFMHAVRYRWPNVLVQFEDFDSVRTQVRCHKQNETYAFQLYVFSSFTHHCPSSN